MHILSISQYNYKRQYPAFKGINIKALTEGLAEKLKATGTSNNFLSSLSVPRFNAIMAGAIMTAAKANKSNTQNRPHNTVCSPGTIQETKSPLED